MPVFTALIFTGTRQCLVRQPCADVASFHAYLADEFGVYVCLWMRESALLSE